MTHSDFAKSVREACLVGPWNQGVKLARSARVLITSEQAGEVELRIVSEGTGQKPTVTLYLHDYEWTCDCDSQVDPCAHVAAATIALAQGSAVRASSEGEARIEYRFSRHARGLALDRVIVDGSGNEHVVPSPIERASTATLAGWMPSSADIDVDRLLAAHPQRFPEERLEQMLRALEGRQGVSLDGTPVHVSREPVVPTITVRDRGSEIELAFDADSRVTSTAGHRAVCIGDTLHPIGALELSGEALERLPRIERFAASEGARLAQELLPKLEAAANVRIETNRLPNARKRMAPRLEISTDPVDDGVSVNARIVYGAPPIARVRGEGLELLGKSAPIRDMDAERQLAFRIRDELNLALDRAAIFRGHEAMAITTRIRNLLVGLGEEDEARTVELAPHVEFNGDTIAVSFSPSDNISAEERIDAERVLVAWANGWTTFPLRDGRMATLPLDWLGAHGEALQSLVRSSALDKGAAPHLALAAADIAASLDVEVPDPIARIRDKLLDDSIDDSPALPTDFRGDLWPYQRDGVRWLTRLRSLEAGAILADDMGLGKTVQAICALEPPALVVCPKSVLFNWASELARFRPRLAVQVYAGANRSFDTEADVVLTTYGTMRSDIERLAARRFSTLVIDEAQTIKNPDSQVARAACRLDGRFRIALSGTPIENRLLELYSIFEFSCPGLFGTRAEFVHRVADPIERGDSTAASRLRRTIRPFLLRRKKSEVLQDLPPRVERTLSFELDEPERALYDAVRADARSVAQSLASGAGKVASALEALLRLRQAACHPGLLPGREADTSSKVACLIDELETICDDGHRALVFSQWTSLLDRVEPHLTSKAIDFARLDGGTRDREGVVGRFQSPDGPPVLLLSLKAGGTGLNLTAADHVFLLDPWWNPTTEDQAADRAHRIGQKRSVLVHRLIAKDTIEERITALQQKKRHLADLAIDETSGASALTREELIELLS